MVLLIILLIVGVVCAYRFGLLSPETKDKIINTVKNYTENVQSKREICQHQQNPVLISLIMIFFTIFIVLFLMGMEYTYERKHFFNNN